MKILITDVHGFVGSNLVEYLSRLPVEARTGLRRTLESFR